MMKCKNCNAKTDKRDNFCGNCGQKKDDLNRPFRSLLSESFFEALDIDGRLFSTLRALLFKPGNVSSSYRLGKRLKYTPPLRMYLVTSVILFFIMSLLKTDIANSHEKVSFLLLPTGVLEEIPKVMILLLPFYALVFQLLQPKTKYIFNLVFSVHIHTFWYLSFILFLLLQTITPLAPFIGYFAVFILVYLIVYQAIAIKNFFASSWLKSLVINLTSTGFYLAAISLSLEIVVALKQTF